MTTSSSRFVHAVLITLFLAVLPLNNPAEILEEETNVQPVGGVLDDYGDGYGEERYEDY